MDELERMVYCQQPKWSTVGCRERMKRFTGRWQAMERPPVVPAHLYRWHMAGLPSGVARSLVLGCGVGRILTDLGLVS